MRRIAHAAALTTSLLAVPCGFAVPAVAAPAVVVSVKPVHSLAAAVMQGVATPSLLLEAGQSPHTYSLTPSQAAMLERADLVVWVGPALESFLARPVRNIAVPDASFPLIRLDGLSVLQAREGGAWAGHDPMHGAGSDADHGHGHEHALEPGDGVAQGRDSQPTHTGDTIPGETIQGMPADTVDPHVWLDPSNAKRIVDALAQRLRQIDPDNAAAYRANAKAAIERIDALDAELEQTLRPVRSVPYVVFHDAYHYFENHFGTNAVGSITLSPDRKPGAQRLAEIRRKITELDARCVFREPQFAPDLVQTVVENTDATVATLDPLGVDHPAGPDAYPQMMRDLGASLRACLSPKS
jgi:zinc transport system substrate-binding protein